MLSHPMLSLFSHIRTEACLDGRGYDKSFVVRKFLLGKLTPMLHKYLGQKPFARSISDHKEAIDDFQDLTVRSIRFRH